MEPSLLGTLAELTKTYPWWVLGATALLPLIVTGLGLVLGRQDGWRDRDVPASSVRPSAAPLPPTQVVPPPESAQEPRSPEPVEVAPEPEPVEVAPEPEPVEVAAPPDVSAEPEPEVAAEPVSEPEPPPARLRDRLRRTSDALVGGLGKILGGGSVDDALLTQLEELLFHADLGVRTADELLERVRREGRGRDASEVTGILRGAIAEKLARVDGGSDGLRLVGKPHVILVLGVNGSGKTTTIGKLAARHVAAGHRVVLGAGDTFRAAAIEQLQIWGERAGCDVIAGKQGGDPAAVAFDTVKAAVARKADVAIIDTAGRLQTKKPLMEELGKLARVIGRELPDAPHETLLVLDANTGQNALSQAKLFTEVAPVSGLVLTKLDGTARGGVIVGLADAFGIPVRFVGVGEGVEDLRDFRAEEFVDALFEA